MTDIIDLFKEAVSMKNDPSVDPNRVRAEQERQLVDKTNKLAADEKILDQEKKNNREMKRKVENMRENETAYPDIDEQDELLIEVDDDGEGDLVEVDQGDIESDLDIDKLEESFKIIAQEARKYGILEAENDLDEDDLDENVYDPTAITESKSGSNYKGAKTIVRMGREARRKWFESRYAIGYARAADDPMYRKLKRANRTRRIMLANIKTKYASKAKSKAREAMRKRNNPAESNQP